MSGSAYGHSIERLTTTVQRCAALMHFADPTRVVLPERWLPGCQGRNCDAIPIYRTRYLYVTGRAGRVTSRIQYACAAHGATFAERHGLTLPEGDHESATDDRGARAPAR